MIAAFEILIANNAVRSLVREGKTHQIRNVLAAGRAEGMCTLETWLNHLVENGLITYEDALVALVAPEGDQAAARNQARSAGDGRNVSVLRLLPSGRRSRRSRTGAGRNSLSRPEDAPGHN